ncbi:MAG: FAD-dependent oxidoreductase [Gammaproteobacteria bacterium]
MSALPTRLLARSTVARGTEAFSFLRPQDFRFQPGQAVDLVLSGAAGELRHAFSIVSAPQEEPLTIATRMRPSEFKTALSTLPAGAPAALEGPFGSLTLRRDESRAAVLLAGGIGVTPFVSMLRDAARAQSRRRFLLLHSCRRPDEAPFLDELRALARRVSSLGLQVTMTGIDGHSADWNGRTGRMDAEWIASSTAGLQLPVYYLAGSPGMVAAMREMLEGLGVEDDDVKSEEFFGY